MENMENTSGEMLQTDGSRLRDRIFVLISVALGFLLFDLVLFEGFGISMPVFVVLFYAAAFWYLSGKPGGINKRGLWLLLPIALLSACFALYSNMVLAMLNTLLLIVLVTLQLATMTGNRLYRSFSLGYVIDIFHTAVALPIVNIPSPFLALKRDKGAGGKKTGLAQVFIGLAISLPVLLVVLALLSSADFVFEKSLNSMLTFIGDNLMEYVLKIIFGIVAAIPLFGLMFALRGNRAIGGLKRKIDFTRARFIDEGVLGTVFTLLNVVYLIFIAVQFGYLFGAFKSILPAGFNHSSYARRGFFELMGVSAINLCMLGASFLFSRRRGGISAAFLKGMETALVALTLLLIASAFSKMAFYMQAYGLTLLRVYTSWFMMLCAVVFVAVLVKLYVPRFALTRFCSAAFVVMYLALNFANVDALVPIYNINLYQTGAAASVDVDTFYNLSGSAIPYAAELLDSDNKTTVDKARQYLEDRSGILNDTCWQTFTLDRLNAQNALRASGITQDPESGR